MPPAAAIAGGAIIGGIAGSMPDESSSTSESKSGIKLGKASGLEKYGGRLTQQQLTEMRRLGLAGPGTADVEAGAQAQRDLAAAFQQAASTGGLPSAADFTAAQGAVNPLFEARRVAQSQAFSDQLTQANRQAAMMGRDLNDPILQAKLAQEQTRQAALLSAEQQGAAGQLALGMPGQRLSYLGQGAQALGGLSQQAWANRAALLQAGQSVLGAERAFRLEKGQRWTTGNTQSESGGGVKGALTGALGGAGSLFGMANQYQAGQNYQNYLQGQAQAAPPPQVQQLQMPQFGSQFQTQQPGFGYRY